MCQNNFSIYMLTCHQAILNGVMVIVLSTGTKVCGFKPGQETDNLKYNFLWRGSKAVITMP
jgi:hypothetical protein